MIYVQYGWSPPAAGSAHNLPLGFYNKNLCAATEPYAYLYTDTSGITVYKYLKLSPYDGLTLLMLQIFCMQRLILNVVFYIRHAHEPIQAL